MAKKKAYTFQVEPELIAQLKTISSVSRGSPKVSALIREAIGAYINEAGNDQVIADALSKAASKPRLFAVGNKKNRSE
jgi:predicted DNA-binding protein